MRYLTAVDLNAQLREEDPRSARRRMNFWLSHLFSKESERTRDEDECIRLGEVADAFEDRAVAGLRSENEEDAAYKRAMETW